MPLEAIPSSAGCVLGGRAALRDDARANFPLCVCIGEKPLSVATGLLTSVFYHLPVQMVFLRNGSSSLLFTCADAKLACRRVGERKSRETMRPTNTAIPITSMDVTSWGLVVIRKTIPTSIVARVDAALTTTGSR